MAAGAPSREDERNRLNPAHDLPELSASERREVGAQSRPNAALIHETIRAEGESELDRSLSALLFSGLAAGLSMGFSLICQGLILAHLPDMPGRDLIGYLGYTVGFLIVVMGRQQLFTENTLTPVLPLLYHGSAYVLRRVLRLWAVVLAANIAGTFAIAFILAHTSVFPAEVAAELSAVSRHAIEDAFSTTLIKAAFAGWLIALMVWLLPAAADARPLIIILITYVVALGAFAHIIAGSVDAFYLVETGQAGYSDYLLRFFLPTLVGNVIGGVGLVAALNYGQVAAELGGSSRPR